MENNAFIVILIFRPLGFIFQLYSEGVRILKQSWHKNESK